jgi:SAM-dependent methyltransferase
MVHTRNHMGWSSETPHEYSQAFLDYAASPACAGLPVLDIGAAYGVATLPALAAGATVYANDLDPEHFRAISDATPPEHAHRLRLVPGRFPDDLSFAADSLGAVHASNVLHFLPGEDLRHGLTFLYRWLVPAAGSSP